LGTYTLSVKAKGFKPVKQTGIRVTAGEINQQNVRLSVGAVTQQVTVSGAAATLQTQQTNVHTTLSNYAVQNLPLNVYHNFQTVETLAPGVVSTSAITGNYPNSIADTPDRSLEINSDGLPAHINTSRVDGATDVFIWLPDHMVVVPPAASIQQVSVQTSNYSVSKGLTAGAATEVITKSGTNQFHGQLYGYHTDEAMDAQNSFVHTASGKKPKNIKNNDGVAIGGPIVKNKLFFFGNWDGYFQHTSPADQNLIPPADMRQGNFQSYLGPKLYQADGSPWMVPSDNLAGTACTGPMVQLQENMIFDPTTGNPLNGSGRCVFQNNVIPSGRMYQGAGNFWQLMQPYTPNSTFGQPLNQFTAYNDVRTRNQTWTRNIYTGKVDYNINNNQSMWVKYTAQKALLNDGSDYGVAGAVGGTGVTNDLAQMVTMAHTWTVSPNLVLTGHIGFTRMGETNTTADFGKKYGQSVLGLVNSNTLSSDSRYSGMPGVAMDGFTTLGTAAGWEPMFRNDWQLTLDEHASWIKGKHTISFGFDAAHNHLNEWQAEIYCCPRGYAESGQGTTFNDFPVTVNGQTVYGNQANAYTAGGSATGQSVALTSGPWNSAAAFDMGLANVVDNSQQYIKATSKNWDEGLYVGDVYRVTPKLTVDAGLRWEYYPMITRDGVSKFEVYNPATNQLLLGGLGGNSTHLNNTAMGVTSSKKLFAPRLGIAYQLNGKTVIRTAYGITYDTLPLERPLRGMWPYSIGISNGVNVTGISSGVAGFLPYANYNASTNSVNAIPGSPAQAGSSIVPTGLANGIPLITGPGGGSFTSGALTVPDNVTVATLAPGRFKRGYVQFWNFTIQRKLPWDTLMTIGYVGNHLVHQLNGAYLNASPLGGGTSGDPLFNQFGRYGSTYQFMGYLDSHYNSLQISFNRHVTHGLFLQGSYTYSKVIGYIDDEGWENGLAFNCTPNNLMPNGCQSLNRHTLSFDHTHVFNLAFIYNLPFGAGQKFANSNRTARAVLGGWQVNGVFTGMSGTPLFPSQTSQYINTPGTSQVPNFAGNLQMIKGTGPGQQWFNTSAFSPNVSGMIGNGGRGLSWLRGPGFTQLDLSMFRTFKLSERFRLKMRGEMINFSNTPHFNNPDTSCSIVTASNGNSVCGGNFGQITSGFGERIIQIGAQLEF